MKKTSVILSLFLLASCASKHFDKTSDTGTLQEAKSLRERGFYEEARQQYLRIRTEFPQSPLQVQASLEMAHSYYDEESYPAAATAYQDFLKTYPGRPEIPEALYFLGMSYAKQMPNTPQRDTKATALAVDTFARLMVDYPDNPHKEEVNKLIETAQHQLAEKIFGIGRYYEDKDEFLAASKRFASLTEQYPDSSFTEEAAARQISCLRKLGETEKADTLRDLFEEKFPKSKFSSMISP